MPRRLSSIAIARAPVTPCSASCVSNGATAEARLSAFARREAALARAASRHPFKRCVAPAGLPSRTPRAFAAASAAFVRSLIISRSCSAIAASTWRVNLLAWGASRALNGTSPSSSAAMTETCRARRSSFAMISVAPCRRQKVSAAASCGRAALPPLSTSTNSAIIGCPAALACPCTAARCASRPSWLAACFAVLTRMYVHKRAD